MRALKTYKDQGDLNRVTEVVKFIVEFSRGY